MSGETLLTIIGTTCAEPELRFTPSGAAVCNVTVASNARHFDKATNAWVDDPALFIRCNIWREMAESVSVSLPKGTRVIVQGRLKQRSFEVKGEKRTTMELDVDEIGPSLRWASVKIAKATRSGADSNGGSAPVDDPWTTAPATKTAADSYADSDIPF